MRFRTLLAALSSLFCVAAPAFPGPAIDLARVNLAFEPNVGQGTHTFQYFARGAGFTIALKPGEVIVNAGRKTGAVPTVIRFAGSSTHARPVAEAPMPGTVNYFIGKDRRSWHTGVPTYGAVKYAQVYPGIDVRYYGTQGRLEFDFEVAPGADASAIRLVVSGSRPPRIDRGGDLVIGDVVQHKPVAYQRNPDGSRHAVGCEYALLRGGAVKLKLANYDRRRSLVIDPVISYTSYLGGTVNDGVTSVKVDAGGNLFLTGFTTSANFPARNGAQTTFAGANSPVYQMQFGDAFVAKLNPAGTAMLYSTYLGGSGDEFGSSIAVDSSGNAYVVGSTQSANFPTTAGAFQRTYKGFPSEDNNFVYNPGDGFAAKLNPAGNSLLYSTYLGGSLNDLALGVAVDSLGDAVIVGATESHDWPTTSGAYQAQFRGAAGVGPAIAGDAYVTVLNPSGTALVFSTYLGGQGRDGAAAVAVDAQNNIYVAGGTSSGNFPTSPGAFQSVFQNAGVTNSFGNATTHAFVTKFSAGGALAYSTLLGGESSDGAAGIAVDAAGNAYVTGSTQSSTFPTTANAPQRAYRGRGTAGTLGDIIYGDAFVAKLNSAGTALVYSTYLGGRADDAGASIALDGAGNALVAGFTLSSDFPVTADALQSAFAGFGGQGMAANIEQQFPERARNSGDAFVAKLSATGALTYSSYFGGKQDDAALAIAVDSAGNAYLGGNTLSNDLRVSAGAIQSSYSGAGAQFPRGDGFVLKLDFGGALAPVPARINIVAGFTASGNAGSTLPAPFTVEVVDAAGARIPGVTVAFSAAGATVSPASAVTDSQGRASATVTLGGTAGAGKVTASVAGIPAVSADLTINAVAAGPRVTAFVNGASFQPNLSPGSWVSIFIDQTAARLQIASAVPLPLTLGGYRVLVNGTPIPVYAIIPQASGTQINAQLPYGTAAGNAQAVVEANGVTSAPFPIAVQQIAPGIFVFGSNRAVAQNVNPDGTLVVNTESAPVPAGGVIVAYLTGPGPLDNPVPTGDLAPGSPLSRPTQAYSATIGDMPAAVDFLGMTPGQIGLAQANIRVPRELSPGTYPLVIRIGPAQTNAPVITVTNPQP